MRTLIKKIKTLDAKAASKITEILKVTAVLDEVTLILLKSNDFGKRLKGIKNLLETLKADILGSLKEEDDFIEMLEKRFDRILTHLEVVVRQVKHARTENKFKQTNRGKQVPDDIPKQQ